MSLAARVSALATAVGAQIKTTRTYLGGSNVANQTLIEWTQAEAYEPTNITRDANGLTSSAVVRWPDGSAGLLTCTNYNATYFAYDGFNVTHSASGKKVTQDPVTRDAYGNVTVKPALAVA